MTDLSWVEKTETAVHNSDEHRAYESNPGWHLLHVTGGLHTPVSYVYGWGEKPSNSNPEPEETVDRILWNERPTYNYRHAEDGGNDIDEIVIHDCMVHIEQMNENDWWIAIYKNDAEDRYWMGHFIVEDGVMSFYESDNGGLEWDRDECHDDQKT